MRAELAVAVVDHRPLVRLGVLALLASHADRLVTWASASSVAELVRVDRPDSALVKTVVILGQTAHPAPAVEIERLSADGHAVVVLDDRRGAQRMPGGMHSHAMLAPGDGLVELVGAAVAESPVVRRMATTAHIAQSLTPREAFVLHLLALGLADKQIAAEMSVAEATVKEYLKRIRRKYAEAGRPASNRVELLRRALEDGHVGGGLA